MIFKKNKSILSTDKLKYYSERDVKKEPITTDDLIQINVIPENNAGKDYMKQHLHYINTMVSREFVYNLTEKMLDEAELVKEKFNPENLAAEQIGVWLAHGYCFAMTEALFEIARKGLISSACRDAISEMAMLSQMEKGGSTELVLHCLYRGFEISRINVPVESD